MTDDLGSQWGNLKVSVTSRLTEARMSHDAHSILINFYEKAAWTSTGMQPANSAMRELLKYHELVQDVNEELARVQTHCQKLKAKALFRLTPRLNQLKARAEALHNKVVVTEESLYKIYSPYFGHLSVEEMGNFTSQEGVTLIKTMVRYMQEQRQITDPESTALEQVNTLTIVSAVSMHQIVVIQEENLREIAIN